ncbi:MAG: hypothetical protein ACJ76Y_21630 [Thermoanaerobaculia bacterium]
MSKRRIALVAAGLLLGLAALLLVARGLRGAATPGGGSPDAVAPESRGRGKEKEPPPRWQSFLRPGEKAAPPRPLVRLARKMSDPFDRPQGAAPRPAGNPGFQLQGISTGGRAVALVSGHAVREGDKLAGYRVVRISRSAVTLSGPGGRVNLALRAPGVGR